jgi:dienelactone hydrolase
MNAFSTRFTQLALLLCLQAPAWSQQSELLDLPTRQGVTQRLLWSSPETPKAAAVLLVGGNGGLRIAADGSLGALAGNFLVRTRDLFLAQGIAVALVDAPSDRQSPPYLIGFRQTPEHATDIKAVIAAVRQRTGKPVALVGTSRGTESAAYLALQLADGGGPDALVLTSSILTDHAGRDVSKMPLETLRIPVLVVHHLEDGCSYCLASDLPQLTSHLPAGNKLITYQGGRSVGDPCEAKAHHGFNGIEDRVVQDIAQWMLNTIAP